MHGIRDHFGYNKAMASDPKSHGMLRNGGFFMEHQQ